ncbi:uncharacterized protein LOC111266582 [Varroa jacobsoni]|uniref:uncharacterized protein LOC111266582 n=1 Tax=Varroa jacobsoni TaxID=62625 RepID=UPI000BF82BE5|nr:uncharacterized protein LOC111266582 [Varroa jacobsoni]
MSAFIKHPSTHVFFHVQDKSAAQQASPPGGAARRSGASALGLGGHKPQGLSLATGSRLSADHASLLAHGPHGQFGSMMSAAGAHGHHHASHITLHLSGHQQQAGSQPHRPVSTILSGGSSSPHAGGEWDDFDLFCQSSYPRLSPLGAHPQFPGQSSHHALDSQLIEETSLGGPAPLNAQPAFPSAYGGSGGGSSSAGGGRLGGRGASGAGGSGSGAEDDGGSGSKAPPPRLRSNSYYSIPLAEPSGHNPTATTGDHRGTDHRALAETYEYHRSAAMAGGGAPEWEGGEVSVLSGGSRGGARFDHPTKGGLRPPGVNSPASGKWGHEWDMHGQGHMQGVAQPSQHGPSPTGGGRRPQDMTREPLAPTNRTNAYHLKDGQYMGAWGDAKGQRGAENHANLAFEGLSPPPPANPVDVLTVSASMLHRILPGVVQPLKVGQYTSLCGLAISSIHVTERDTCVVMDMCESAGFCARDLPSPATELLPLPRDWISVQLARHKHTFGWFKHNYNTATTVSHRDSHKGSHIPPHHPLSQVQGGQQTGRGQHSPKNLLLMNVERNSQFPFMTILSCRETELARLIRELDELHLPPGLGPSMGGMGGLGGSIGGSIANLANTCGGQLAFAAPGYCANCSNATGDFHPMSAQQTRIHHTGAYIEVASLARRKGGGHVVGFGTMPFGGPMEDSLGRNNKKMTGRQELDDPRLSGDPQSASALDDDEDAARTGYIVSFFRVFPGEDSERLDRSWPLWTGARQIHGRLPKCVGLNRISFHKKVDPHSSGITYVLLCECPRIMDYLTEACVLVDQLRARCCGYTALYRVIDSF